MKLVKNQMTIPGDIYKVSYYPQLAPKTKRHQTTLHKPPQVMSYTYKNNIIENTGPAINTAFIKWKQGSSNTDTRVGTFLQKRSNTDTIDATLQELHINLSAGQEINKRGAMPVMLVLFEINITDKKNKALDQWFKVWSMGCFYPSWHKEQNKLTGAKEC